MSRTDFTFRVEKRETRIRKDRVIHRRGRWIFGVSVRKRENGKQRQTPVLWSARRHRRGVGVTEERSGRRERDSTETEKRGTKDIKESGG